MNKWECSQVKRAVKIHAEAPTREKQAEYLLTPAQARLVWWGMRCLNAAIRESVIACHDGGDYADDLRCHADATEWGRDFMDRLRCHAESEGKTIVQEGVTCV